jgi:glycosyltransferase involved in cell wall biosynthesis
VAGAPGGTSLTVCRFLQQVTGIGDESTCAVAVDACTSCCSWPEPEAGQLNPVVASLLFGLAGRMIAASSGNGGDPVRAAAVRDRAEAMLATEEQPTSRHIRYVLTPEANGDDPPRGCDVVLCCADASEWADRAVRSILNQQGVKVFLHLVDDGGGGAGLLERYGGRDNVVVHRNPAPRGLFQTLHERVPHLRSEFVAVQDATTISLPGRLASAVGLLVDHGADLLAAALKSPCAIERPELPGGAYRRAVPPETLVFRRAALVDMGGVADRPSDADVEVVHRAACERRAILLTDSVTVQSDGPRYRGEAGPRPEYIPREGTLRHHALGFPADTVACDVVLPFHGQIEYVRQALLSLLEQEGVEVVIHLIDDVSPGGEGARLLGEWRRHPRVRTYRNSANIGPYSSFNNVLRYLETSLVAVQDGDDISLPRRLQTAGNLLAHAGAEIFGGRTRPFGAETSRRPSNTRAGEVMEVARPPYRGSRVPRRRPLGHIIEHPTAMFRTSAFERIGGFADFGRTDRNCCGLDTEFYLRAAYSTARFAASSQVVLLYRCHPDSATQNRETGWGSAPRTWTLHECRRRALCYRAQPFDPSAYGALGRFAGVTERTG